MSVEFAKLVIEMRKAQKAYFRNRQPSDLERSKQLEKQVDQAAQNIVEGPGLFGEA